MSAKHTPGPWYYDDLRHVREESTDICIALIHDDNGHPQVEHTEPLPRKANALIIAAAPDLLEALQYLLAHPNDNEGRNLKAIDKAKAAIAKATGAA